MKGTVRIIRTYYLSDTIQDGAYMVDHRHVDDFPDVTPAEAAERLISEGLTFAATGGSWAADPNGSYETDYMTGMHCETSGHLLGFPNRVIDAIQEKVG